MHARFLWIIVPSLLFILGCSRHDTPDRTAEARPPSPDPSSFRLYDVDGRQTVLSLHEGRLTLGRVLQPIVILHLFSTRAEICRAMLPDLSHLQHTHPKELFVLGVVVPETIDQATLRAYMRQNRATFFISHAPDNAALASTLADMLQLEPNYPLPMTLVFSQGRLIADYEGATPIEMILGDLPIPNRTINKRKP